ncbi:MAG TPA: type VI secretion system protein TssA, partial [Polyangiaceae bacterium]|nr:type VI secretion system protein TssA [Polyangiaceae bacterium]
DLRIAAHLARALGQSQGYEGFSQGLGLLRGLIEGFWDTLHPLLDPDDDNDPTMRVNALAALAEPGFLNMLRSAPLVRSKSFGGVGLRELAFVSGELTAPEGFKLDAAALDAAFQEVDFTAMQATLAALRSANEHIDGIDAAFASHADARGPDLAPLTQLVKKAIHTLDGRIQLRPESAANGESDGESASGDAAPGATGPSRASGDIRSRDDVLRALSKIETYYARYEPSSPIPLMLQRCKRLVPMSFIDIVKEIAPDGLTQVELVVGKREDGAAQ